MQQRGSMAFGGGRQLYTETQPEAKPLGVRVLTGREAGMPEGKGGRRAAQSPCHDRPGAPSALPRCLSHPAPHPCRAFFPAADGCLPPGRARPPGGRRRAAPAAALRSHPGPARHRKDAHSQGGVVVAVVVWCVCMWVGGWVCVCVCGWVGGWGGGGGEGGWKEQQGPSVGGLASGKPGWGRQCSGVATTSPLLKL